MDEISERRPFSNMLSTRWLSRSLRISRSVWTQKISVE